MNKEDLGITYIYRERKREKEIYSLFRSSLSSKLLNKNSARYNIQKKKINPFHFDPEYIRNK